MTERGLELDFSTAVHPCGNHVRNFINPSEESVLRPFEFLEESYKNLARSLFPVILLTLIFRSHVRSVVKIYNSLL